MKKLLALLLISVLIFSFTSCAVLDTVKGLLGIEQPDNGGNGGGGDQPGETCEHVDDNDDGKCDKCGESYDDGQQIVPGNGEIFDSEGDIGGGVELPIIPVPKS